MCLLFSLKLTKKLFLASFGNGDETPQFIQQGIGVEPHPFVTLSSQLLARFCYKMCDLRKKSLLIVAQRCLTLLKIQGILVLRLRKVSKHRTRVQDKGFALLVID